jgi:hypothetical protein
MEDHDMSDDYAGYEDDPTSHDGYATETHDPAGAFGDLIGQPIGEIGDHDQSGHDDTTTYPADEPHADPYATEGQEQATDYNGDGTADGYRQTDGHADPYATEGHAEGNYPAQPASEADPGYAADGGDRGGRDAFNTSGT